MTQWTEIKQLFGQARELPADRRRDYVDRIGDPAIRAEVESLLTMESEDEDFLTPVPVSVPRILETDLPDAVPPRIGAYRVDRVIGEGGMGTVFEAARDDGSYEQAVAIKVLRRGLDTDRLLARFRRERQTLALLDHPNIARLLDGGALPDGRPYLVMERVAGLPIDSYCDRNQLGIAARLRLFLKVADAVSYAHANLVVHRDLKPGNIFVTDLEEPKLLDFGIAKILSQPSDAVTLDPRECPFTPEFASPEQILGRPVSTASDVYSLGVVLYRLLAGHSPYSGENAMGIETAVVQEAPRRPSTAFFRPRVVEEGDDAAVLTPETIAERRGGSVGRLRRLLSGDLDSIVLKALAKDPRQRYASVADFAEDLRRYLDNRPVAARHATVPYLAVRFLIRNRWSVLALAVIVALLGVGGALILQQADDARAQTEQAEQARDELEQINEFLTRMLSAPNPENDGHAVTVRELLDRSVALLDADQATLAPRTEATLRTTLGTTYFSLGHYSESLGQHRRALELREEHCRHRPEEIAWSLNNLATVYYRLQQFELSRDLMLQALEYDRRAFGDEHEDVAQVLNNLMAISRSMKDPKAALEYGNEALRIREKLSGPRSLEVAETLNNLGNVYRLMGKIDRARELLERSKAIREAKLSKDHPLLLQSQVNLGILLVGSKEYEAAEALFRQGLAGAETRLGPDHPDLGFYLGALGRVLMAQDRPAEAIPFLRRALELRRAALPPEHTQVLENVGDLGECLIRTGELEEGRALIEGILEPFAKWVGEDHERVLELKKLLSDSR